MSCRTLEPAIEEGSEFCPTRVVHRFAIAAKCQVASRNCASAFAPSAITVNRLPKIARRMTAITLLMIARQWLRTSYGDGEEIKSNAFCGGPVPYMQIAGKGIFGANDED
jgi:hypothetical protein